jgi:hypothetical protein
LHLVASGVSLKSVLENEAIKHVANAGTTDNPPDSKPLFRQAIGGKKNKHCFSKEKMKLTIA